MTINELSALLWGTAPNQPQDTGWFDYLEVTRRVLRKRDGTTLTMYRRGNKVEVFERFSGQALCEHYEALATPEAVDVYCDTVAERYLRGQTW